MIHELFKVLWLAPFVVGCAVASPIRPVATSESPFWWPGWGEPVSVVSEVPDGEQFRISHRGSTGFTSVSSVRRSAKGRATKFCKEKNLAMTPITEQTSSHPHILGNFPRFEMVFICTEKASHSGPASHVEDPYERLRRLKELLGAGVISQDEFDREKDELLRE